MAAWSRSTRVLAVSGSLAVLTASGAGLAWAASTATAPATAPATAGSQAARLHTLITGADKRFGAAKRRATAVRSRVDQVAALAPDRTLLDGEIDGLLSAIKAAQAKVDVATTPAEARASIRAARPLVAQGRVIVRQVRQLRVADAAALAEGRAQARIAALSAKVSALPAGSPAHAALADLTSRLQHAAQQAASVLASDRSLSVSDPAAAKVLTANEKALRTLQTDRRKIAADRRTILAGLQSATKKSAPAG